MGHERKRGKLEALNNLLRGKGEGEAAFSRVLGDLVTLRKTAFVITKVSFRALFLGRLFVLLDCEIPRLHG